MDKNKVILAYGIYGILTISLLIFSLFYAFGLLTARGVDFEVAATEADRNILIFILGWIATSIAYVTGIVCFIIQQKRRRPVLVASILAACIFFAISISSFVFTGFF